MAGAEVEGTSRAFVAVWPPVPLRAALEALELPHRTGLRLRDPAALHITMRFLGVVDLAEARSVIEGLRFDPTEAFAGPALERLGSRHLVVPVSGLDELAADIASLTSAVEEQPSRLPFLGHLTLATGAAAVVDELAGCRFECDFTVDEVALVASSAEGYRTVARYPATDVGY